MNIKFITIFILLLIPTSISGNGIQGVVIVYTYDDASGMIERNLNISGNVYTRSGTFDFINAEEQYYSYKLFNNITNPPLLSMSSYGSSFRQVGFVDEDELDQFNYDHFFTEVYSISDLNQTVSNTTRSIDRAENRVQINTTSIIISLRSSITYPVLEAIDEGMTKNGYPPYHDDVMINVLNDVYREHIFGIYIGINGSDFQYQRGYWATNLIISYIGENIGSTIPNNHNIVYQLQLNIPDLVIDNNVTESNIDYIVLHDYVQKTKKPVITVNGDVNNLNWFHILYGIAVIIMVYMIKTIQNIEDE